MSLAATQLIPELATAKADPDGGAEAVRDLLATVLHEVRTPLACLTATAEVLADSVEELGPRDARAMLRRLQRSATWLQALVDNLTAAAQLEAGQLPLGAGPVDLAECAETALALVAPLLERAGQAVGVAGAAPLAWGDARHVEQALVNLLMNASKYGGAGSPIRVELGRLPGRATVAVADRGPGIPVAEQERIFERYARGQAAVQSGASGLGLGLHIVRTLVERQGGAVALWSEPGRGATFTLALPLAAGDASAQARLHPFRQRRREWR
jgi:signal transduction histidine kinase